MNQGWVGGWGGGGGGGGGGVPRTSKLRYLIGQDRYCRVLGRLPFVCLLHKGEPSPASVSRPTWLLIAITGTHSQSDDLE